MYPVVGLLASPRSALRRATGPLASLVGEQLVLCWPTLFPLYPLAKEITSCNLKFSDLFKETLPEA